MYSQSWTFCAIVSRLHCNERGGRRYGNDYIRRGGYTVILARIILKQESGGVGILDHIKARANDVESLLITLHKPMYYAQSVALGAPVVEMCSHIDRCETLFQAFSPDLIHINPTTRIPHL